MILMKKYFKHNNFLHHEREREREREKEREREREHFTTAILLQPLISYVVELLSKLNSTGFSNSSGLSFV